MCVLLSCIRLLAILWTIACQSPLSTDFSRPECQSGYLFPFPGDLPDQGRLNWTQSSTLQADSLLSEPPGKSQFLIRCTSLILLIGGSTGKESTCNEGDLGLISGLGRSPGEGKVYPLQYSGLENSMDYPWGRKESDTIGLLKNSQTSLMRVETKS